MRVLHLWQSPSIVGGGGGVSMLQLHEGLLKAGVQSQMMCNIEQVPDGIEDVVPVPRWRVPEGIIRRLTERIGLNDVHRISSWRVTSRDAFERADVVHIHGTHGGFLSYLALPAMSRRKPVVFTLRDMWAMTGHCAYSHGCERWRTGCGSCPHLSAHPEVRRDATRLEWRLKRRTYARSDLDIVAVSSSMAEMAQHSLLANFPIHLIHNGVDTNVFQPSQSLSARRRFDLPADHNVILFCAVDVADPRKGWPVLYRALRDLPDAVREMTTVLLVGAGTDEVRLDVGVPVVETGRITSRTEMADAYVAADVFVFPTEAEALGRVAIESIACGTPVIATSVGGVPDVVRPGETGLLVPVGDATALRQSLVILLSDDEERRRLSTRCRDVAVREFSNETCVRRHLALYRTAIERRQEKRTG